MPGHPRRVLNRWFSLGDRNKSDGRIGGMDVLRLFPDGFVEYELVDSGEGRKLERFGEVWVIGLV